MATSSIFASFDIKEKNEAERFVEALEASANDPKRERKSTASLNNLSKDEIQIFMAKRKTAR